MAAVSPLDSLNPAQRTAAAFGESVGGRFTARPLLVIAGAGTGKTNTLAHRVAHLVLAGVDPARILLLTFTRRAAVEMTRRTERIVSRSLRSGAGDAAPGVRLAWAGTFHSIANRLLRQYAREVGLDPAFSIVDRGDAADLLDIVRHEQQLSAKERRFPRKDTCLAIYSHRVNTTRPLKATLTEVFPWCLEWEEELTLLFRAYVARKQREQVLDYDDLLLYWHVMLGEPALAAHVGAQFDHVLVDEYQDTNTLQAGILQRLKPDGTGVTVVGDDAQAIYSFRAATVDNILEFPQRYAPPAEVIVLEENYRSTQPVLDAANALLASATRQYRKILRAHRRGAARPQLVSVADDRAQADYVVAQVLAGREAGLKLMQQAVLFRSSHHSDVLELELVRRNIPYVKYGGLKFLEAAHVKDLLAILRWADNPRNSIAAFRALQLLPGMGPAHSERCLRAFRESGERWETLASWKPPALARDEWSAFATLLATLGQPAAPWAGQVQRAGEWYRPHLERLYEAAQVRAGDLDQLERLAPTFLGREQFLTELTLEPPQATGDLAGPPLLDEDYLVLSTIHSAKGQEWESVYVLNVSDGNFPSEFAAGKPEQLEEERRLLYVAMTRARTDLRLIEPLKYYVTQQSRTGDRHVYGARSRFLTRDVLNQLAATAWPEAAGDGRAILPPTDVRVDVAAALRDFW